MEKYTLGGGPRQTNVCVCVWHKALLDIELCSDQCYIIYIGVYIYTATEGTVYMWANIKGPYLYHSASNPLTSHTYIYVYVRVHMSPRRIFEQTCVCHPLYFNWPIRATTWNRWQLSFIASLSLALSLSQQISFYIYAPDIIDTVSYSWIYLSFRTTLVTLNCISFGCNLFSFFFSFKESASFGNALAISVYTFAFHPTGVYTPCLRCADLRPLNLNYK